MPDTPATASTAESTAAPATATTSSTATESAPMTAERAREILRDSDPITRKPERDPLTTSEVDPLTLNVDAEGMPAEAEAEATETEAAPETETAETTAEGEATGETEEEAAGETESGQAEAQAKEDGRKRLNINRKNKDGTYVFSDRERAILQLVAEESIPYHDAEVRLYGETPAPQAQPQAKEEAPAAKAPTIDEITAQIVTKRAEREQALNDFDNAKAAKISNEIEDLIDQRNDAKFRAREAEAKAQAEKENTVQNFAQREAKSMEAAMRDFPDTAKPGTRLFIELQREIDARTKGENEIFQTSDWPELLAAKVAKRLGINPVTADAGAGQSREGTKPADAAPGQKPAAAPKPAAKPMAPVKRTVPLLSPGGVSGGGPSQAQTLSQEIAAAKAANDLPKLKELMRKADAIAA